MKSIYEGKIKVIGVDRMCWPVDPKTFEACGTSGFDAYPRLAGDGAIGYMSFEEWNQIQMGKVFGRKSK